MCGYIAHEKCRDSVPNDCGKPLKVAPQQPPTLDDSGCEPSSDEFTPLNRTSRNFEEESIRDFLDDMPCILDEVHIHK